MSVEAEFKVIELMIADWNWEYTPNPLFLVSQTPPQFNSREKEIFKRRGRGSKQGAFHTPKTMSLTR